MASLRRLLKHRNQSWRAVSSLQTLTPASRDLPHRSFRNITNVAKGENWKSGSEFGSLYPMMPVLLAGGLFGVGMVERAYADGNEGASQSPALPGSPSPDAVDMEKIAREERSRLRVLLNGKGMQHGSYPPFLVATKGRKVSIKFPIPQTCDTSHLIANIIANLGLKAEESGAGSSMILHAWDSAIAWQLKLNRPEKLKGTRGSLAEDQDGDEGDFCVLIFHSLLDSKAEIEFIKEGRFSLKELEALASSLKVAAESVSASRPSDKRIRGFPERREIKPDVQAPSAEKSVAALEAMGVRVFGLDTDAVSSKNEISWDIIAGYDQQKREIEDTILLALHSPEVYDDIARGTRRKFESNRPRAVLFEGPPGTGKTSCARVIANQAGVPLLYVPLEVVMSKYYGESERLLGSVFSLANELPNGAIIFLDEVDSFAAARDDGMHEATRRVLSVLLRQIDGFEQDKRVVVIAATNRKEDLDPALISRFDSMITFGLPDRQNRQEIVAQYAKHLTTTELMELAAVTEQMSGRDIRDVCQQAERHWASKIIRGQASGEDEQDRLPPIQEYIECAVSRQKSLLNIPDKKSRDQRISVQKKPMDFI